MALDHIWGILNSNLVTLFQGGGIGFLFVKLVWEPFKSRHLTCWQAQRGKMLNKRRRG